MSGDHFGIISVNDAYSYTGESDIANSEGNQKMVHYIGSSQTERNSLQELSCGFV